MLNWWLRYEPFLKELDRSAQVPTVLDVGSGWYGLSWYWPHPVVQTDLRLTGAPPAAWRPGTASYVCASADRLPFATDGFDVVLSSDLMEHLPVDIRVEAVRELTRVARSAVLLGFPSGRGAAWVDRGYGVFLRLLRRPWPDWLQDHLAQTTYPSRADVTAAMPVDWEIAEEQSNGNVVAQLLLVVAEDLPVLRRICGLLERRLRDRRVPGWIHLPPVVRVLYVLRPRVG
ncbi:MAG: hypothetical protein QOG99_719 [Frankiales bacterium]|nr:hypothetical protein [Frankiales bacterium]